MEFPRGAGSGGGSGSAASGADATGMSANVDMVAMGTMVRCADSEPHTLRGLVASPPPTPPIMSVPPRARRERMSHGTALTLYLRYYRVSFPLSFARDRS